ncbi:MAG: branched chain amino acid aminotransferase, partial [Synergistaceae bacterium]|nr:branched chain amino acid aminotransferase [Synergistaceae bacterium]
MQISVTKNPNPGKMPPENELGFGRIFTDHMFIMDYTDEKKWHNARILPYGPIPLMPSGDGIQYANTVFEGMKAYRWSDGSIHLFRPMENAKRINVSAERIGLPQVPNEIFLEAVRELVKIDSSWVPSSEGTSLYIRPFIFATDEELALHGIHKEIFVVILSPSASYFAEGIKPVKIML